MRIDRYARLVLTVIALALVLIAVRPWLSPVPGYAARTVEYRQAFLPWKQGWGMKENEREEGRRRQEVLNTLGKEGWELISTAVIPDTIDPGIYLLLRR